MSTGKSSQPPGDNKDEPAFRYSLELVATIAAQFAGNGVNDREATERAIQLLNAVGKTIEGKMIMIRARKEAERLSLETPKHLPFAAGIRYITGKPTETEATTAFRDYLRLNLRLSDIGRPSRLTDEEVKAVLKPLPEGKEKEVEDARIEKIIARERSRGFGNNHLINGAHIKLKSPAVFQPTSRRDALCARLRRPCAPRTSRIVPQSPLRARPFSAAPTATPAARHGSPCNRAHAESSPHGWRGSPVHRRGSS